ncbi:Calcineurin-like phosphoesterase [Pedobacter steynii]|uniref:acid phosphatase n=1 Tax=Pedobacter steynii TaxID=430522 RepID=A0A1G9Y7C2_9SPHI|nr:metallophosphoesterase [Pedobacter steynii]NQX39616.1 metallophosphoesterase [Pedobacter steynii]SDN04353.1 Calcineurin-like phosphoesterase [Pedobacter steynii]
MKRRDFVKSTALTAIGASMLAPLQSLAVSPETYLESEDVAPRNELKDDYPIHFMAVGDWGRNGADHQKHVAVQMGKWATENPNDFILSLGDNFYPKGVTSEHDPLWHYSFENIYTDFALQWDWYPILGNHDYISDPDAQVRYSKISRRWKMPSRYYSKEVPIKGGGKLLMVFIDTCPLIPEFHTSEQYQPWVKDQQPEMQLKWLDETLKNASSEVKWTMVMGHHPIYTVGPRIKNYDTLAVRKALSDIFERNKVDVYLSGHDHSLQHLSTGGFTQQFISGAGSEVTHVTAGIPYSKFEASEYGFMYFSVDQTRLNAKIIDHTGKNIYETTLRKV